MLLKIFSVLLPRVCSEKGWGIQLSKIKRRKYLGKDTGNTSASP
jgi:hypothetical protein